MVASTWITTGCMQFLKNKKRFHTAWIHKRHAASRSFDHLVGAGNRAQHISRQKTRNRMGEDRLQALLQESLSVATKTEAMERADEVASRLKKLAC